MCNGAITGYFFRSHKLILKDKCSISTFLKNFTFLFCLDALWLVSMFTAVLSFVISDWLESKIAWALTCCRSKSVSTVKKNLLYEINHEWKNGCSKIAGYTLLLYGTFVFKYLTIFVFYRKKDFPLIMSMFRINIFKRAE